jgi:N-acetylmuramoyl-L-alanine amidase
VIYGGADVSRLDGSPGKLGCLVRRRNGADQPFILSNAHVLAYSGSHTPDSGDFIVSPATTDPANPPSVIAKLTRWAPFDAGTDYPNVVDAAIAAILEPALVSPAIKGIGLPAGVNTDIRSGMQVQMSDGETTRTGTVLKPNFACNIPYLMPPGSLQTFGFRGQVQCSAYSEPGNSGSVVFDMQNCIVGLHLGGSATNSIFTPIQSVMNLLGVEIITTTDAASAASASSATLLGFIPPVGAYYSAADILARTIWGESRGEPEAGKVAVTAVICNRAQAQKAQWGLTVEQVCQKPKQFSCWNTQDPNFQQLNDVGPDDAIFASCLSLARRALAGQIADPTQGATYYCNLNVVKPNWAANMQQTVVIRNHTFFRSRE